jgi:hypothetical protein
MFSISGSYTFDTVQIDVQGPVWRPDTVAYFDDFNITATTAAPEPGSFVLVVTSFVVMGALFWLRRRAGPLRGESPISVGGWRRVLRSSSHFLFLFVIALCIPSIPAKAGSILFSDLGPAGNVYNDSRGIDLAGSGSFIGGSNLDASQFAVAGSGSLPVTQIDLAVANDEHTLDTFYASIWTDNAGVPGVQVLGAYWSLAATTPGGLLQLGYRRRHLGSELGRRPTVLHDSWSVEPL